MVHYRCCNPFKRKGHLRYTRGLRKVSLDMSKLFPILTENTYICDACRMKLRRKKKEEIEKTPVEQNPSQLTPAKIENISNDLIDRNSTTKNSAEMMALRWGIASAGKISHDFVTAVGTLPESEHVVVAIAARELSRAQQFADLHKINKAYDNYAKLAEDEDIDVVYIGMLNPQHFETAKLMLNHGKHVLCEKPLTMNTKQTTELIDLAKSKKLFLMEGIWSRFFPIYENIKKEIDSGSIGEIYQVIAPFGFKMPDIERLQIKSLGGGTVLDLGVYAIQFACLVFNNEVPHTIHASGCLNEDGVDQSVSVSFQYKGNRTATIITHSLVELPNEAYIIGTKGIIKIPQFWCPTSVELPSGTVNVPLPTGKHKFYFINSAGLRYEAVEVRNCILKGMTESSKVPHSDSLLIAQLEDEIRKQVGVIYPED